VRTGEVVALKKVRFDVSRDGVPVTSMREMRILQSCRHPNIVQLKKVVTGSKPDRWAGTLVMHHAGAAGDVSLTISRWFGLIRPALGACSLMLPESSHMHHCSASRVACLAYDYCNDDSCIIQRTAAALGAVCSWCLSTATMTWRA
jgi:serine/threonine protein kinase